MRLAMPNKWLHEQGLLSLKQLGCDLAPLRGTAGCGPACQVVWGGWSAMATLRRGMVAVPFGCAKRTIVRLRSQENAALARVPGKKCFTRGRYL